MSSIFAIARYTFTEQIRNRLYMIILFFGFIILCASILLGALAPTHRTRVIFDLGLVALEVFGLATAIFGSVTLVLQEMESKTIYLIITRPISRASYILGRFLGLICAVAITMGLMAIFHVIVMWTDPMSFREFVFGWSFWAVYPVLIVMSMLKMLIVAALAIFFSLFATSSVSALIFTGFLWVAGHFGPELSFLIKHGVDKSVQPVATTLSILIPNFQYLNFRDLYTTPGFQGMHSIQWAFLYAFGYSAFYLIFSSILFSRKEF